MANIYPASLREMASLVEKSANEEVRKYAAEVMRRAAAEIERLTGETGPSFDEIRKTLKETPT